MIVITADQRNSRGSDDAAEPALSLINSRYSDALVLPAERTAGDEIQMLVTSGGTALSVTLDLTRHGRWSVGVGFGAVRHPLGSHVRESAGPAFVAARAAVDHAKKSLTHFAIGAEPDHPLAAAAESLIDLLLLLRSRRTAEGWELHDLLRTGITQAEAAGQLGITPQSASQRSRVAGLRVEDAATVALANLLDNLDAEATTEEAH